MTVNPWFFYVIHLCTYLKAFMIAAGFIGFAFSGLTLFLNYGTSKVVFNWKLCMILCVIILLICTIMPNRETLLLMNAAELVNYQNLEFNIDTMKRAMDYASTFF